MYKKIINIGVVFIFIFLNIAPLSIGKNFIKQDEKVSESSSINKGWINHIWPMYKHDSQHTGQSQYNTIFNCGGDQWKYFIDSSLGSTPVIDNNGTLYVSANGEEIHAIDPNGSVIWKHWLIGKQGYDPVIGYDGTIYVGTNERFHAFYQNGTLKWIFDKEEHFSGFPTINVDDLVFVGTGEGNLYALYSNNGTIKWKYFVNDSIRAPALDKVGNVYFTTYSSKNLYCLNSEGGYKWKFQAVDIFYNGPVIGGDGTIYLSPASIWIQAINPNGAESWRTKLDHGGAVTAITPDDSLIISGKSQYVTSLDSTDGSIDWIYKIYGNINDMTSAVIGADGTIYFAYTGYSDSVGYLCALNPDGSLKWETHLTSDIQPYDYMHLESDLSIGSDGTIYVTSWFGGSNLASYGYLHSIGKKDSVAPDVPTIEGLTRGKTGIEYTFDISSVHPSGKDVYFFIDWGDNSFQNWIGPYPSGEKVKLNHTWDEKGSYFIKAKAKGDDNLCSIWTEHEITIPKTKTVSNVMWYQWFLERFPMLDRLLYILF